MPFLMHVPVSTHVPVFFKSWHIVPSSVEFMLMQVKHYERLSPLKSSRQALGSLSDVRAGDCVIAFSRAQIYAIKVGV
jgi:hypothetical protein